eukprot:GHVN01036589.1.p1 GENE.GHVN01036589.1~~GHVN01036589.1.p1  ORF type:complete len:130 (+),score=7.18 GHVN01036589.1:124-513(+)
MSEIDTIASRLPGNIFLTGISDVPHTNRKPIPLLNRSFLCGNSTVDTQPRWVCFNQTAAWTVVRAEPWPPDPLTSQTKLMAASPALVLCLGVFHSEASMSLSSPATSTDTPGLKLYGPQRLFGGLSTSS